MKSPSSKAPKSPSTGLRSAAAPDAVIEASLGFALRRAHNAMHERFAEAVGDVGITPQRYSALTLIDANPGLRQTTLGQILGVARSGAVVTLDALEGMGLIARRPVAGDGRAYALWLTEAGAQRLAALKAVVLAFEAAMLADLTAEERETLFALLSRIG
jgi:DNA-binding MarR family transcriptional regulator